ncbi:NmrA-like family protein [Lophiostoma macrostomum CBS 122681]|uniref:NmrA-like family protein n=1 Tax=Lophiostoma macrostomum CBS 122681 TaxID=1314788 RepID=A0A6A6SZ87_9PLEO|nr:NmrA-like family protein [Lophiostoma macrostomum CBS 122681]
MTLNRILLIGGTGNLGTLILKHLLASPSNFTVSVLSRRSANTSHYPAAVKIVQVDDDYPPDQLTPAFSDTDVVISAISMMGMHHQPKFIDACVAAKVKRYIPTEFGLEDLPQWLLDLRPMFKTKHDVRDYLVSKESAGLSWTCVCCNVFFEMGIESGFFQFYWAQKRAVLLNDGELQWPATTLDTVAIAVVRVIEKEELTANKILLIQDFMTSQKEVLNEIEQRTGKWEVQKRELGPWLDEAKEKTRNGQNEELSKLTFAVAREAGDWAKREEYANALLDLPTKPFKKAIEQALEAH